jgi:hypothetical protein
MKKKTIKMPIYFHGKHSCDRQVTPKTESTSAAKPERKESDPAATE